MAERIEWEEIEQWRRRGPVWSDVASIVTALEAGEELVAALAAVRSILSRALEINIRAWKPVGPITSVMIQLDKAEIAWRRCVAPRGEGA